MEFTCVWADFDLISDQNDCKYDDSWKKNIVWVHQSTYGQNGSLAGWHDKTSRHLLVVQRTKNTSGVFDLRLLYLMPLNNMEEIFVIRCSCPTVTPFWVASVDKNCFSFCRFDILKSIPRTCSRHKYGFNSLDSSKISDYWFHKSAGKKM
jgi:hypothetical protein